MAAMSITKISVKGFKSLYDEQSIEIRPLTILAGANSSGKSSIMQPLLLMKQTLEATTDPGALKLDGPNVRFTSSEQIFSKIMGKTCAREFAVYIELANGSSFHVTFSADTGKVFEVKNITYNTESGVLTLKPGLSSEEIIERIKPTRYLSFFKPISDYRKDDWGIVRDRCFLEIELKKIHVELMRNIKFSSSISPIVIEPLAQVIHLPGLRGNPQRNYPRNATGTSFPGEFQEYAASLIAFWHENNDPKIKHVGEILKEMGLSWKVSSKRVEDTRVELQVSRLPINKRGGALDLVNIADVGFGVSQTLPVVVALVAAQPGQLVYIEQPEIHLHPKAQIALAKRLCWAAKRGVKLVIETHSAMLLHKIQTLVAKGEMPEKDVALHWFQRDEGGVTKITTAELDEDGAYGDWPEDFAETELAVDQEYLDTVDAKMYAKMP